MKTQEQDRSKRSFKAEFVRDRLEKWPIAHPANFLTTEYR